jgi:DNA polymerase elongation subunit (family B)
MKTTNTFCSAQSGFYTDPVVVCDFTALYPSLVIGYNLCYSTIAGVIPYESSFTNAEAATKGKIGCMKYNEVRSASVVRNFISRRTKRMDEDMTTKTSSNDGEECMEEEEVSERSERALIKTRISRDESREMATDGYIHY